MTSRVGTLPAEVSSFVDREWERAELKRLLAESRLVTVTGLGGVGKTRTALRVAVEIRRAFRDGVWWVDLAALTDPALLTEAVAEVLGLQDQTAHPHVRTLADYLAGRRLLLVLDTCEHLVDACAELTDTLLRAAPELRVLATSQQPLGVAGEVLWARVSVFAGDFDLPAAEAVCADGRLPVGGLLDVLAGLVDKSILLRVQHAGTARYRLLDSLREYGQQLLDGDESGRLRRRHRDYYLRLARHGEGGWCGRDQPAWCELWNREHANLRAALDHCLTDPAEHRSALELGAALRYFWVGCGFVREGRHYLDRALALDAEPGPALTAALWTCAWLALAQGDLPAVEARLVQCRPLAERHGDRAASGWIAFIAAAAAMFRGDLAGAVVRGERSAALHRRGGDAGIGLLQALVLQAMALALAGSFERAAAVAEEGRRICDRTGERWMRSYIDYVCALTELRRGDAGAAETCARDALRVKRLLRDNAGVAMSLDVLAAAAAARGRADRAARLLGLAHQVWHTFGLPQFGSPDLATAREQCERVARGTLGDQRYEAAFRTGRDLDLDAGIGYALDEQQPKRPAAQTADRAPLTRRETQIAELVGAGLTTPQIAARLVISKRTVDSHIEHILDKLGLTNRTQIAAWVSKQRTATGDAPE